MCSEDKLHKPFVTRKTYNLLVSLGYITYINCILGVDEGMSQMIILLFLGFLHFSLSFFPYFHFYFLSRTQIHKRVTAQIFPFSHPILPSTSSSSGPCLYRRGRFYILCPTVGEVDLQLTRLQILFYS